jgi:hypothetical protein
MRRSYRSTGSRTGGVNEITPSIRRDVTWEGEQHVMQRAAGRAPASPVVPGLGVRVFLPRSPPAPREYHSGCAAQNVCASCSCPNRAEKSENSGYDGIARREGQGERVHPPAGACESHGHRPRQGPAAFMGAANRSPPHIEPVSRMPKRKLENGEQRLAPQSHQSSPDIPEFAGQRLRRASLTRGNIGGSHTPGYCIVETALAGWAWRIRTGKCHFEAPFGKLLLVATKSC